MTTETEILRHASLFSGIGGFDLAAQWMGWENVFHCEINPFCQRILKYYWPNATSYIDIKTTDFTVHRGTVDILTGGFPCQPFSQAGQRKGTADDRYLWPEMLRAIREIRPRYIVGENVYGLVNWDGGLVFDTVCADLEECGYEVWPFILPACGVGAPHKRERIWFIAVNAELAANGRYTAGEGERDGLDMERNILDKTKRGESSNIIRASSVDGLTPDTRLFGQAQCEQQTAGVEQCNQGNAAYESSERLEGRFGESVSREDGRFAERDNERLTTNAGSLNSALPVQQWEQGEENFDFDRCNTGVDISTPSKYSLYGDATDTAGGRRGQEHQQPEQQPVNYTQEVPNWRHFPTQSPVCNGNDGISSRLDGITFPRWRNESIKGGGNAIVPQVALQIFKAIEQTIKTS